MTSFKKYFLYHFRSTFLRFAIIAILCALLTLVSVWYTYGNNYEYYSSENLSILQTIAIIISTIIPILEFLPFKNKRNMDTVLFLPLERRKMAAIHFANGFLHTVLVNLVCFIVAFFVLSSHSYPFYTWNLFLLFAFTIFGCLIIYAATAFIFERANTTADGIIWLIFYAFIGISILYAAESLYGNMIDEFFYFESTDLIVGECLSPYFILSSLWYTVKTRLMPGFTFVTKGNSVTLTRDMESATIYKSDITGIVLWSVITPLLVFGLIWLFKNKRAENIGSISSSPFGYKVLLPLLAVSYLCSYTDIETYVIMLIVMVTGYIIYRRGLRFKPIDYISIALGLILPSILVSISQSI